MLAKTVIAAAWLALAQFAVATPPGCLLSAVNTYDDPSDIKTVCKSKDLSSKVEKLCGSSASSAMSALADICNDQGIKVASAIAPSNTASGIHASGSASAYSTGSTGNSTVPTATGGPTASGGPGRPTGTSSGGSTKATGAAGRIEIGIAAIMAGLIAVAM